MSFLGIAAPAIGGALVSGLFGRSNAKYEGKLALDNWKYQQSNAHQLEVQDLRNAGLNPILSATNSQMANMAPVHGSDYGAGQAFTSALQGALDREAKKEMQAKDIELENLKLKNEQLRIKIERDRADSDIKKNDSDINLNVKHGNLVDKQADYTSSKQVNETRESDARIRHIAVQIENENKLTDAQVAKLRSGIALDNATIDKLAADTKLSIERSNLSYWEKTQLITNLTDSSAQLKRMNAKQQLEYLSTGVGEIQNKTGFGFRLMSPIQGFGFGSNGYSTVRF